MATNPDQANTAYNSQAAYKAQAAAYPAQATYDAQVHEAQAAYQAQVDEVQATYEAQFGAQQPIIIHTTANWFWQCHLCGHANDLHDQVRDFWRSYPSVLDMQSACSNSSSSISRSNHTNSNSRVYPNNLICGHERCGWCFDLDENRVPVRFSSGIEVARDQYNHFWGWRFWAERVGLPRGQVSWEAYEEFCACWFGDVPTMMPLPVEPLE